MHYHAEVYVPKGTEDIESYIATVMEPHREDYNEATDTVAGFWDWYQIGGRWTGEHDPDYDPETDPGNIETCTLCNGTGFRDDELGRKTRADDPSYTCNSCGTRDNHGWHHGKHGAGKCLKWPTQWVRFSGDSIPVAGIKDDLSCYTLVINETAFHQKEWNGETFADTEFDGKILPVLKQLALTEGLLVTVDYHT